MSWYKAIRHTLSLPEYIDKTGSIGRIMEKMTEESPLAREMLAGRATLESTVEPIVRENLAARFPRKACISESFRREAEKISGAVGSLIDLGELTLPLKIRYDKPLMLFALLPTLGIILILTAWPWTPPLKFSGLFWDVIKWSLVASGCVSGFFGLTVMLPEEMKAYSQRREEARRLREGARFLDETFAKFRRGESFD